MQKASKAPITIEAIRRRKSGALWLLALVIVLANFLTANFFSDARESFYLFEFASLVVCLATCPKVSFNTTLLLLITMFGLSTVLNDPAPYFRSWERLAFFTMILSLISPLIENNKLNTLRNDLWHWLILIIKIEIIVEFIYYIPWIIENYGNHKGYIGIFGHHMLHGIVAAVASTVFLWELVTRRYSKLWLSIVLFLVSLVILMSSGSRCALLGFTVAAVPLLWSLRKYRKLFYATCFGAIFALSAITFIPNPITKTIRFKFDLGEKNNSWTFSRDELWKARWNEFTDKPILGIGFCANTYSSKSMDLPDKEGNIISEPGSAWLSILSNGGILSFGLFAWFNIALLRKLFRRLRDSDSEASSYQSKRRQPRTLITRFRLQMNPRYWLLASRIGCRNKPLLYFSLWLLLIVHGVFEGWVLYAGSLTFFFYWLLTSQISNMPSCNNPKR